MHLRPRAQVHPMRPERKGCNPRCISLGPTEWILPRAAAAKTTTTTTKTATKNAPKTRASKHKLPKSDEFVVDDDDESQDDVSMEDDEESGLATMERFKDDLFADDDDDKPQEGVYSLTVHSLMTQVITRF